MNRFLLLFFLFVTALSFSQVQPQIRKQDPNVNTSVNDTLGRVSRESTSNKGLKNLDAKIEDYKIISVENDTTIVDTTLTIAKLNKFNYLRKDDFGFLRFSNIGQTYNTLSYSFNSLKTVPVFGARARHFNHMEIEDIHYFYMPTPFTELMYKTAFEQGQLLDSFFTVNLSPQFNFSLAYKGLRSLGKYQHILTSTGNFRFTTNYKTKNNRYQARGHIVFQDQSNQENGGLRNEDIENFESGNAEFKDRSVFDPNFEDAESILEGKRFYFDHKYNILQKKDSINNTQLNVGNVVTFEDKFFRYEQESPNAIFGDAFTSRIDNRTNLEHFYAEVNSTFNHSKLGMIKALVGYTELSYGYDKLVFVDGMLIPNRINDNIVKIGAEYRNQFGKLLVHGKVGANISGEFDGNYFLGGAGYQVNPDLVINGEISTSSKAPNFNFLLHQSDYINYNWENNFSNVETRQLSFHVKSDKYVNVDAQLTSIDNYTFFQRNADSIVKPFQSNSTVNYLRIRVAKELRFKDFALDNTIEYQNVLDGEGVLNVPEFITRNTLYYHKHLFKKALYLQTGITFNYFTKYNLNAYDPVLAEFYVQNDQELGGFPRFDFFVNIKVRQTRIYLMFEHFNSSFTGYNYYSAPNYPYRDFVVRFGLVWNFFL